jgi:hypothetical protein
MSLFEYFLDAAGYFPSVRGELLGNAELSARILQEARNTARRLTKRFNIKHTLALRAVSNACAITRWEDFEEHARLLRVAPYAQQSKRDYFANSLPLLAVDVPSGLLSRAITHTDEFYARMSAISNVPVAELKGMMVARWSADLPQTAETFDKVLRYGLQRVAPQLPLKPVKDEGYADYNIFVSVGVVLSGEMAVLLPSEADKSYTRKLFGQVRDAVEPLIPEHVSALRARMDSAPGYRPFDYEAMVCKKSNAGPQHRRLIGMFGLPTDALVGWAYWAATEGVPGSVGAVSYADFIIRSPEHLDILRQSPLRTTMPCPCCGQQADLRVAMVPSPVHNGDFELTCFCGHTEKQDATRRETADWHRKLTWLNCGCSSCMPARNGLKQALEKSQKGLANRVVQEVERFAGQVLDAQAGRNGLRLTDDGFVDDHGTLLGQWTERRTLPRYTAAHSALGRKIEERTRKRLPVTGMLVTEEGFTRQFYRGPVAPENVSVITKPSPRLRFFMEGFNDDASFLAWASSFVALAHEYFLPVPIHVAVWKGKVAPPWLDEALSSQA